MQEADGKSQKIAVALIIAAVVIFVGYYALSQTGVIKASPGPAIHASGGPAQASGDNCGPGQGSSGSMAGGSPVAQVGSLLDAEVFAGHGALSSGGSGAQITSVNAGGPAEKAGIKDGDVVASCNGQETSCPQTLLGALQSADAKKPITLQVDRGGKLVTVTMKPGALSAGDGAAQGK